MANPEVLQWKDETAGKSHFSGLKFDADHYWTKVEIEVLAFGSTQSFAINLAQDGFSKKLAEFSLGNGKRKVLDPVEINKKCTLEVTGKVEIHPLPPAGGEVTVKAYYKD